MRTMKINLDDCRGVTDDFGRHYAGDSNNEVTIPNSVANRLESARAVRRPYRAYGGITLPTPVASTPSTKKESHDG